MNLAIFDLDHTLINVDSDQEWVQYLVSREILDTSALAVRSQYYQEYVDGTLDIDAFLAFQLAPLAKFSPSELAAMHREFMDEIILPAITPMARELVQAHRDAGDQLLMISATNEFIITPIAHEFGIMNVIGISLETDEHGRYTGRYVGTPSFQSGKVVRLEQWLLEQKYHKSDFEKIYFYSDSKNDLPLLNSVTDPVAVNPDETLLEIAQQKGWPILHFL